MKTTNPGASSPRTPATRTQAIAKGEPTKGSGSDTSPYSSARKARSGPPLGGKK